MAILKEALVIAFTAGVLTAGLKGVLPYQSSNSTQLTTNPDLAAPSTTAGEPARLADHSGGSLTSAYGSPPALVMPNTPQASQSLPPPMVTHPEPETPAPAAERVTGLVPPGAASMPTGDRQAIQAPANATWTSTPHPEIIAKADARFDNGDIAGVRSWLEAALEAGDADAAYRLAETYDPAKLAEWRVIGIASDVDKARTLYERAMSAGVEGAKQRADNLSR